MAATAIVDSAAFDAATTMGFASRGRNEMAKIHRIPTPAYTNPDRSATPNIDAAIPLGSIVLPGEKIIDADRQAFDHHDTEDNRTLLRAATRAQERYWDAVRKLELALGIEIDDLDFSTVSTVQDVMEYCEGMKAAEG